MSQVVQPRPDGEAFAVPVAPAFYRMPDVVRISGLSRATVYRRMAEGRFPPSVHLGGRACGWRPATLQAWIDDPEGYVAPRTDGRMPERRRGT